ncbi:SDR family oxidoreductase [Burkholderia sp. Ax-1719]|uniref:UDP-glucose 4-epimerase family protein n=1 Tax=Burkholderia sp. Ax-1719 TaxID=2608334 RepID=UPI00141FE008|nr:SDR family oxidoreductase [Burkholderia sp. Ax-1719]NIE65470.1 SDR family oxidoreductase [Burkholderia sp. Ax-1719]
MSQILVTGANGFVGASLCRLLANNGHDVIALQRRESEPVEDVTPWLHAQPDFAGIDASWPSGRRPDCVVHLAARVHVMNDEAPDPLAAFRATNVDGTLRLARAAHDHGVARFVYVSSVKAVAESDHGVPLAEDAPARPEDPYGVSKHEAEEALWAFQRETGMEIVIVRPPLVYGPGVGANFLRMMQAVAKGLPLPLGAAHARRSLVYVENLAHALMRCATDVRAANTCFHVADDDPPDVAQLLRALGRHLGRPARLVSIPMGLLRAVGVLTGRQSVVDRLTSGLQLDASRIQRTLDWRPPCTTDEGLEATVRWFRSANR